MGLALGGETLYELGIIIIFIGVIIVFAAFVLLFLSSIKSGRARGGGALIIGPFPIVFGSDKESVKTILWAFNSAYSASLHCFHCALFVG